MAKKKEEASKIILERNYIIPLGRKTLKVPPYRKAKKAIRTVKEFVSKHMKSEDVKFGKYLNLKIWEHGIRNPPNKVKVTVVKDDKGKVFVELTDAPKEKPKAEEKKPAKKEEKIEKNIEEAKEEKAEEAKEIEKEEIKELQKEHPKHHAPKIPQVQKSQQVHPTAPKSV